MIPFRPTVERTWEAIHTLRYDRRDEKGYEVVMGPHLYAELLREPSAQWHLDPDPFNRRLLGLPIEVDPRIKRGYIHLRHEVIA